MSLGDDSEEPLNLCLKDRAVIMANSQATINDDSGTSSPVTMPRDDLSSQEMESALSVIEQINSLRKFITEKRWSKFYELYLMQ